MPQKSRLDRALSIFADVRVGEGTTALLMLSRVHDRQLARLSPAPDEERMQG